MSSCRRPHPIFPPYSDWEPEYGPPCCPNLRAFTCSSNHAQLESGELNRSLELDYSKIGSLTYNFSVSLLAPWLSQLCCFLRTFHIGGNGGDGFERLVKGTSNVINIACRDLEDVSSFEEEISHQPKSVLMQRKVVLDSLSAKSAHSFPPSTSSAISLLPSNSPPAPISPSNHPDTGFKIGLSYDIIDTCTSIRDLVQANPDAVRSFMMPKPPSMFHSD